MRHFQRTTLSLAAAQAALLFSGLAAAQTTAPPADPQKLDTVVVSGQRAALQSAQKVKQDSDEIVDSIVADDIGKLPDRSVTEVLQRIVGVTIDRTMSKGDPEHFSVEGSGVMIRGLTYVRSELNGRDSFSANGGRSLSFEDVPPELMSAVDVYKNPSAEQIEGAIGGLVNLRTAMPFDYPGFKAAVSVQWNQSKLAETTRPAASGLVSNRWKTDAGEFGLLLDLAHSGSNNRTDAFQVEPYYPRSDVEAGKTVWIPKGSQWRTLLFDRKRDGIYAAAQWRKNDVESSLTYFKSKYKMHWDENALFAASSPYNITVDPGATYDSKGAFVKGTLRDATDGGINFNDDVRGADRKSTTQDVAWHIRFKPSDRWTINLDAQYVKANTEGLDSTVATGVVMPKEQLDLSGTYPRIIFDASDAARLADPANYYWAFTMEHMDKSKATEKALKVDAKYNFDHPVLMDLRFGVRLTDRTAVTQNSNPSYNWAAITQPWQVGWDISHLAYLNDPRFSGPTTVHTFDNFFNGRASVPSLVFPATSTATGFPASYAALHKFHDILCAEQTAAQGWGSGCPVWAPATFGTDPAGINSQKEKTEAGFAQLRFGWEELPMPIDGNLGLRVVHSNNTAHGYTVITYNPPGLTGNATSIGGIAIPNIASSAKAQDFDNSYTNVLPSLNLRMKATKDLQFRLAMAQAITRPDFTQLQAYSSLSQTTTQHVSGSTVVVDSVNQSGIASGNPMLKPVKSNQFDLTAEWYPEKSSSLTLAVFDKQLKDIILNQVTPVGVTDTSGTSYPFMTTAPVNGGKGYARGLELAFQKYFDMLPGAWAGLGVQANYTYVQSKTSLYNPVFSAYCSGSSGGADNLNLNLNGCDVNGRTFTNLPLQNMSKNAFNLAVLYDHGPFSARVAYSWRSRYLQAVNVNGTQGTDGTDTNPASATVGQHNIAWGLPTWAEGYGELDASLFVKVNDKFTVGIEGSNLTDTVYKQSMQQSIGTKGRAWFVSGPRYTLQARYTF